MKNSYIVIGPDGVVELLESSTDALEHYLENRNDIGSYRYFNVGTEVTIEVVIKSVPAKRELERS